MDKEDVIYIFHSGIEYYSVIRNNKILPFVATWMDLKGIMLSEISQIEKDKYYVILLTCRILGKKSQT